MSRLSEEDRRGIVKLKSNVEVFYPPKFYKIQSTTSTISTSTTTTTNRSDSPSSSPSPSSSTSTSTRNPSPTRQRNDRKNFVSSQIPKSQTATEKFEDPNEIPFEFPVPSTQQFDDTEKKLTAETVRLKSGVAVYYPESLYPKQRVSGEPSQLPKSINQSIEPSYVKSGGSLINQSTKRLYFDKSTNQSNGSHTPKSDDNIRSSVRNPGRTVYSARKPEEEYNVSEETTNIASFKKPDGIRYSFQERSSPVEYRCFPVEVVEMDVDLDTPTVSSTVSNSIEPMEVDAVKDLRLHEDYLGSIPPVTFNIPDVEMSSVDGLADKPQKCLILDTNIIVGEYWPEFLDFLTNKVPDLFVVQVRIPHMVLLELDKLKAQRGTPVAWRAKGAARDINERFRAHDRRFVGQTIEEYENSKTLYHPKTNDDCILFCCLQARKDFPNSVYFVTNDINLQNRTVVQNGVQVMNGKDLKRAMQSFLNPELENAKNVENSKNSEFSESEFSQNPEMIHAANVCRRLDECVEILLLKLLSDFLEQRLKAVYENLWKEILGENIPPWKNLSNVLNLIEKFQKSIFIDVFKHRDDVKIFSNLIFPDLELRRKGIKSPREEMNRLADFLKKAVAVAEFLDKLDSDVTATYRGVLNASLIMLKTWESKRFLVENGQAHLTLLEEEVFLFVKNRPNST